LRLKEEEISGVFILDAVTESTKEKMKANHQATSSITTIAIRNNKSLQYIVKFSTNVMKYIYGEKHNKYNGVPEKFTYIIITLLSSDGQTVTLEKRNDAKSDQNLQFFRTGS